MTIHTDLCDFCGHFLDPIGCDTAMAVNGDGTYWDGQCEGGLIFYFRNFTNAMLDHDIDTAKELLDNDGLDWENRGTDGRAWLQHIQLYDFLSHAVSERERRQRYLDETGIGAMVREGFSLWGDEPS